jgi:succinate dehydrogenase / fumarate reductase flavoprotein subunit
MSESLRNDGRVWVPKAVGDKRPPSEIPDEERDYYLERIYPSFGNLAPRDVSSRAAKRLCDEGRGVGRSGLAVYLDFRDAIKRDGMSVVKEKYGNLFDMYHHITDENPYELPMRIYPAVHYTMGGLWVDYNLMSNVPGLFVLGEANFSDHGANRLGASALMQGLADGYFVVPATLSNYLGGTKLDKVDTQNAAFADAERDTKARVEKLINIKGTRTVDDFHKALGKIMWEYVGMGRTEEGLKKALVELPKLRQEFWSDLRVLGDSKDYNLELEKAGRVADFIELGELMARDALDRDESCGGHFREEHQTADGEAVRNDEKYTNVSAWFYEGADKDPTVQREELVWEYVKPSVRSYK